MACLSRLLRLKDSVQNERRMRNLHQRLWTATEMEKYGQRKKKPFTKSLRCLLCTWTVTLSKHVTQYGPLYYNFKDPWLQNQKEEFWKLMRHIQSLYTFLLHFFLMFFQILIRRAMFFFLRIQILTAALLEITEVECSTNLEILAFSMVYAPNGLWNTACAKTLYLGASKHHQSNKFDKEIQLFS